METNFIIIANTLSLIALLFAILMILARYKKTRSKPQILLALALFLLFLTAFINVLEYSNIAEQAEEYEDIVSILFIPILIFSIHSTIIDRELTHRKRSESKFKGIFNEAFSFIGLLSPNGNIIEVNNTSLKFSNEPTKKIEGTPFAESIWWNHSENEKAKINEAIQTVQSGKTVRFETSHLDAENNLHYVDFSLKPVFDENKQIIFLIPEGRDITEIKLARLELEKHKNNLEELVQERTDELLTANEEILAINEELYDKNQAFEKTNQELVSNKLSLEQTLQELKTTQSHLIESEKMASIGVLSAGIAHEINNPINYINSNLIGLRKTIERFDKLLIAYQDSIENEASTNLKEHFIKLDEQYGKDKNKEAIAVLMNHIQTGVERTVEIVNSLKYFLHSEQSHKVTVNIHDIIKSVLIILHNEYKNRIDIIQHYDLNEEIECIAGKINQVIMNILSNAIHAIDCEGTITISTFKENQNAIIKIKNNGHAIPDEVMPKIFDPFFSTKKVGKGSGLGLYISYNIMKEHNGKITVISNTQDTEFTIVLPIKN